MKPLEPPWSTFALVLALSAPVAGPIAAQQPLAGDWSGYWVRAGDSLRIMLHVRHDPTRNTWNATFDSDRLRVMGIPFSDVTVTGCCAVTLRLQGDRTTSLFTGTLQGDRLEGTFREGENEGRFRFARARAEPRLIERDLSFQNGDATLSGTLILPPAAGPHPAVVFVHGSGAEGRWASRFLATSFARHGVAALIFDKRGVGTSTGDWRTATLDDLTGDVLAAIAALQREGDIDPGRIGIHGHSQGGTLAPMIAVRSPAVGFVIASAAAGTPTDSTELYSVLNSIYPDAVTATDSAEAQEYAATLVQTAYHGGPRGLVDSLAARFKTRPWFLAPPAAPSSYWFFSRHFGAYDALAWWNQVKVPVLLIFGAADQRVPPQESAARISGTILRSRPDADLTVRILPGADHTFRMPPGPSGWPVTAPDYLATLLHWLGRYTH